MTDHRSISKLWGCSQTAWCTIKVNWCCFRFPNHHCVRGEFHPKSQVWSGMRAMWLRESSTAAIRRSNDSLWIPRWSSLFFALLKKSATTTVYPRPTDCWLGPALTIMREFLMLATSSSSSSWSSYQEHQPRMMMSFELDGWIQRPSFETEICRFGQKCTNYSYFDF